MEDRQDSSAHSGHSRNLSRARRQALPRRSTQGPLGNDDPLTVSATRSPAPPQKQTLTVEPLSNNGVSRSPIRSSIGTQRRNFGFLLRPDIFSSISDEDIPEPYRLKAPVQPSEAALQQAISNGRFRDAAVMAAEILRSKSDPTDYTSIFDLFYARLACLQISGLHSAAAQESKALQDLMAPMYRDQASGAHLVPWDLRVLAVRLQAIGFDDWRRGIMAYYDLAREARLSIRRTPESRALWALRLQELGIRIASALIETEDMGAAARFLESLSAPTDPLIGHRLASVYLSIGNTDEARRCLAELEGTSQLHESSLRALCSMADGNFAAASHQWVEIREADSKGMNVLVTQNLATCYIYTGRIQEAKSLLEDLVENGKISADVLFNLATTYELCVGDPSAQKAALAIKTAGLEPSPLHRQRANKEFKV